jgi:hypothetical protein
MPAMIGFELYRRIIETGCAIPTILVTAYPRSSRSVNKRLKKIYDPACTAGKVN